jgi:Histidine kinase-, DNA gyrase B-, and HSP90-like ATPase
VLNLVSNALRYTNAGGIVIGCRHRGAKLRIEVWDTGPGIPPEQRRKVFSEFYRLADAAKTKQAGLGLGLAIVDRLCTLLDHPIELTSMLGKGSRFAVTVPTAAARVTAQPKIEPPSQATLDVARGKLVCIPEGYARLTFHQTQEGWVISQAAGARGTLTETRDAKPLRHGVASWPASRRGRAW